MKLPIIPHQVNRAFASHFIEEALQVASRPAGDRPTEQMFRALIESWIDADCRYGKWAKANPEQRDILSREIAPWTVLFAEGKNGKLQFILQPYPYAAEGEQRSGRPEGVDVSFAHRYFAQLLLCTAPRFHIGKCERCSNFFLNRWGHANKRFCGRKCSQLQTAKESQARKLSDERKKKNARIKKTIKALIVDKPNVPLSAWKDWVASHARVTKSYLTRALNHGREGKPDGLTLTKRQLEYLGLKTEGGSRHVDL